MIHQSRKWRLLIRIVALGMTSMMMLAFAGPVSYALQDDTPKRIDDPSQLFDAKGKPVADMYVDLWSVPELDKAATLKEGSDSYYWIPLRGYNNQLLVRTKDASYVFPYGDSSLARLKTIPADQYSGKITALEGQPDADKVVEELGKRGVVVDKKKTMVLLQGEMPSTYRPIVPVMPVLAILWGVTLAGLFQIWRGRRPGQLNRTALPTPYSR